MSKAKIAAAMIAAKKSFGPVIKGKVNPAFRAKYATLEDVINAVDDACLMSGVMMYQETFDDDKGVTVETVFLHESGEELRCGRLHVPAAKQDPQGYGSALSYARRYSLMAACGIAAEDDDGNAASGHAPKRPEPRQDQRQAPAPAPRPALQPLTEEASAAVKYALESWAAGDKDAVARSVKEVPAAEKTLAVQHIKASAGGNEMLAYLASLNAKKEG